MSCEPPYRCIQHQPVIAPVGHVVVEVAHDCVQVPSTVLSDEEIDETVVDIVLRLGYLFEEFGIVGPFREW